MDFEQLNEQILLIATVLGAIAALPVLIEFIIDQKKRREQIALSLDDVPVKGLTVNLAGFDWLLAEIADLIDRARSPETYSSLKLGNEILIIGPPLSGKKTLAEKIAQEAEIDRLITVYNARNSHALVRAKELIQKYWNEKVMLLLPRLDQVFEHENEEVLTELDALIETSSGRSNVLVIGTAVNFAPDSAIDNLFGIKLVLPGVDRAEVERPEMHADVREVLVAVARFYLNEALEAGYELRGLTAEEAENQIISRVSNAAEIEDIVAVCKTSALYEARIGRTLRREITPTILERSINRVVVNLVAKSA